jgi:hypothetical protein
MWAGRWVRQPHGGKGKMPIDGKIPKQQRAMGQPPAASVTTSTFEPDLTSALA